ncbi:microtubule-associated protein futsch-like [Mercenaria mercenaria]|uniref:microtubule-associated protein futsch-like n=1 Tax=Mercenaria mercenaria TaxID=6596 RepID=UPI00234E3F53|nr:microtubule-associated protein futsch-like [Mercenaria mercenaria]
MALKGPGKTLKGSPYGDPAKGLQGSPYGKLPSKSTKKPKNDHSGSKDAGTSSNKTEGEGVPLQEVFGVLADENGRITSAKLRSYVKELDLDFTDEEIKEMMQVVDPAGKGDVSYNNLLGIVRDFSHEFPTVQLTAEELSRELTYTSTITEESTKENSIEDISEQPGTSTQEIVNSETIETNGTESDLNGISRPVSSRARIAALAKRAIDDLDDQMSVIKEDDEYEEENEEVKEESSEIGHDEETVKEDEHVGGENIDNTEIENEAFGDDKSVTSRRETVISRISAKSANLVNDIIPTADSSKEDDLSENESGSNDAGNQPSRASAVKEHRLDSGVSTAVGRMNASITDTENGRRSRKRSTSETRTKSRRDSVKSDTSRKSNRKVGERSTSRSRKRDENRKSMQTERRKSVPRKKFQGVNDPEFYSTMGCSLKLSQIRTRQRLLYVMWRAVYDQALRKMEQEREKRQVQ